jgi:predicted RND superfamily exporter protein
VGIAWTMAFAELTIGYLNLMTAFIVSILFGLGVDFSIHGVSRYMEERTHGMSVPDALVSGLSKLGKPMFSAAMTTAVTFFSLALFEFRGFSQFGVIAGVGVLLCLAVVILVLPPLVVLVDRYLPERSVSFGTRLGKLPFFSRSLKGARWTFIATIVGLLALTIGLKDLVLMDPDMSKVMTKTKTTTNDFIKQYRAKVERQSMSPIIFPTESLEDTRKLHRWLETNWVKGDPNNKLNRLEAFHSIWSFVPEGQQEKVVLVGEIRDIIRKKLGAMSPEDKDKAEKALKYLSPESFAVQDLPDWLRTRFTDQNGELGTYLLAFAKGRKEDAREVGQIVQQLDNLQVDGKTYYSTASYYIMFDAYDMVKKEGPIAMALAGLMVLLVLLFDFRSIRKALWVFAPLPLGIAAFLGLCGLNGWTINILNMVVLPTLIGIGIDTSIHLYHRGKELQRQKANGESTDTMGLVISTTGAAAGMSSVTTAIGFGGMVIANNPGLASIGLMAPVGICVCYLCCVLLTGSALWFWKPGKKNQEGGSK